VPVSVGSAPTKPGCVSTARWRGSGEHGSRGVREELALLKPLNARPARIWADLGREWCVSSEFMLGNFSGLVKPDLGEAVLKVCGVGTARPKGQSQTPPRSSEQQ
jgi:hypothetical protein